MSLQPAFHTGVFVGPIVIHDPMHVEPGQRVGIDLLEEPNELLVPMPRDAAADYRAIEHAQGREQRSVLPWRLSSCVMVPQRPFFNGRPS